MSLVLAGCERTPRASNNVLTKAAVETGEVEIDIAELRPRIDAFCGNCHSPPRPDSFPKKAWRFEVERGFDFYVESFRDDLDPPPVEAVVRYFELLAPNELAVAAPVSMPIDGNLVDFRFATTSMPELEPPAVSFLRAIQLEAGGARQLIFCDMRSGDLRMVSPTEPQRCELLTTCGYPAHVEPCDLDGAGNFELVVADLGSARSADHARGAVVWLQPGERQSGATRWKQRLLVNGLGRVSDVRPGDFDGDGDSDLVVAEFGHFRTGRILLLENTEVIDGLPHFRQHVIDERHGAIHVPVADMNGDGHLDFVALIAQEYEVVEVFLNDGHATFRREQVFSGNDPAFGSSGIQLVDLDTDGDLDVLYSNGDTFGSQHLKEYHGIHWLDNHGQYPFEDRLLAKMVGVQKALAGDLDGDGDQDIVAVALMPKNLLSHPDIAQHDSVIVLEQTAPKEFKRYGVEQGRFFHAGLELADLDGDGALDVAVGNMLPQDARIETWLTIWSNLGKGAARDQ